MAMESRSSKTFAFIFPMMPGNLNPSLPIVRLLRSQGHVVHYLCFKQFREAICDTGAIFHDAVICESELYATRDAGAFGAISDLQKEFGVEGSGTIEAQTLLGNLQLELQLPGVLRLLREVRPDVVVYSPTINREAAIAAQILKLPAIALLTFAGPGAWEQTVLRSCGGLSFEELDRMAKSFEPNLAAIRRLNAAYHLELEPGFSFGRLDPSPDLTIVSTTEALRYPESPALAAALVETGTKYLYVGPLLDPPGAIRAAGFKMGSASDSSKPDEEALPRVHSAQRAGRSIVFACMGTVVTGDHPTLGWTGRPLGPDGQARGLSGRELCRAAWAGIFDAFGSKSLEEGPLLLVVIGPQMDALKDMEPPPNAICVRSAPQVDILRAGPTVFLTHGGQNSFMEAIAQSTPVLVCPTAIDQFDNALQASKLGIGLWVDRPSPDPGCESAAALTYQREVASKLMEIMDPGAPYRLRVATLAEQLHAAGGVPTTVDGIFKAAFLFNGDKATRGGA